MIIDIRELEDIIADYDHTTLLRECRANEELIDIFNKVGLKVVLMNYEPTLENIAKQISEEIVNLECKNVKNVTIKISDKEINQEVIYFGYTKE